MTRPASRPARFSALSRLINGDMALTGFQCVSAIVIGLCAVASGASLLTEVRLVMRTSLVTCVIELVIISVLSGGMMWLGIKIVVNAISNGPFRLR